MDEFFVVYAEHAKKRFIERFADLDESKHPDKINEIQAAKQLRDGHSVYQCYIQTSEKWEDEARRFVLANPDQKYSQEFLDALFPASLPLDNFGIKAEDVKARIKMLRGVTSED